MSTLDEQMDAVANPSLNYGTGFLTGQRAGDFQSKDGTVNRGVWVGNVKPTVWNLINPINAYESPLEITSSQYIPLKGFLTTSFVVQNFGIVFDAPRTLTFSGTQPFTVNVSSYSQWRQKQYNSTVAVLESGSYYATINRGVKALTAVFIETNVPNSINFIANNFFELPYTDNGNGATLLQVILNNQPVMVSPVAAAPPYNGNWNFTYYNATTDPNLFIRPMILFNSGDTGVTYPDNSILTTIQAVDSAGFSFDNNFLDLNNPYPNNMDKVIGIPPNSENFVGWQG